MASTNGIPDDTPPDKRPRGGYSAPPPEESPRKDATADPSKEYVASSGYGAGLRDYLRALPVYVDDLTREVDLHVYERMRWDECVAGSLDALVYQALADDIDFRPAVDDEDSQYYDDSKAQADTMNRVMADMERPLIEWAYEMVSDAIGGGNRVSEKVSRQEEGGPYSGLWVWDRLKVKPRRHLSFAMDTYNNLRGILTAIPGQYMGLDGSIPVDPKKTPNLLPRSKFAVLSWNSHNDDPRGRPLLRRVYVPWWEKIQVAGEWLKHLSRFGSPSVVGTTAPNSDFVPPQDEFGNALAGTAPGPEQALLNGLERLQNGGCLVLPYGATVTALQVAQSGSAFLTKVDQCDRAISRGVLLAIRAVMEAQHGSKADSQTAQDVTGLVVRYVKNWAARMITRDLVKPLVVWNKGADAARVICPYASLTPVEHQDWSQKATAVAALKTSGFLKPSQEPALAEEMGLPPATEPVEQPQPGQQPGQNGAQKQTAGTVQTPNGAEAPFAGPPDEERDESGKDDPGPGEFHPWQRVNLEGWLEVYDPDTGEWLVGDQLDLPGDAEFAEWEESKHPRGQPENKGQFGPGGGGGTETDPRERRRERDRQRRTEDKTRQETEVKERLQKPPTVVSNAPEAIPPALAQLFPDGSVQREDLPSLVGAPRGSIVRVYAGAYSNDSLSFHVDHPYVANCQRYLNRKSDGALVMTNQMFFLKPGHRGSGIGLDVFSEEVRTLAGLGVDRIETCAGKGHGMNGYYTWARLGYDADLDDRFVRRLPNRMTEQLQEPFTSKVTGKTRPALSAEEAQAAVAKVQDATTVQDLMATPEGREYWLRNGYQDGMRFDLKPGSRSLQVLNDYLQSKGKQPIEVSASAMEQLKSRQEARSQQDREQEKKQREEKEAKRQQQFAALHTLNRNRAVQFGLSSDRLDSLASEHEQRMLAYRQTHLDAVVGTRDPVQIRADAYQDALHDMVTERHRERMTSAELAYVRARQQLETEAARRGLSVRKVRQLALASPYPEEDGVAAIGEAYREAMRYLEATSAPSAATFAEADAFDFGDISLGGLSREEIAEILIDAALDARDEPANAEFYDPNQLRDDRGRWAIGGGSGGTGLPHVERQAQRESAKETVRSFMAGKGIPSLQEASGLAKALSTLTVAQIHEVKKEHGLKASSKDKAGLVAKLAERFRAAREAKPVPEVTKVKPAEAEPVRGEGTITVNPARYAKGQVAVTVTSDGSGRKTRAHRLAEHVGGRWSNREHAYIMSPTKAARLQELHATGRDASSITGELLPAEPKPSESKAAESKASDLRRLRREAVKAAIGDTYSRYNGTHLLLQDIAARHKTLAGALAEAERQGLIDTRQRSPQADVSPLQRDRQGEWVRQVLGQVYGEKEAPKAQPKVTLPTDEQLANADFSRFGVTSQHSGSIRKVTLGGENYFWKGVHGEAAEREALVANLATLAGVNIPTARTAQVSGAPSQTDDGRGLITEWVQGKPVADFLTFGGGEKVLKKGVRPGDGLAPGQIDRQMLFDFLANVEDRHGGNYLVSGDKLYSIDHEYSLEVTPPTGAWDNLSNNEDLLALRQGGRAAPFEPKALQEMATAAPTLAKVLRDKGLDAEAVSLEQRGDVLRRLSQGSEPATVEELGRLAGASLKG